MPFITRAFLPLIFDFLQGGPTMSVLPSSRFRSGLFALLLAGLIIPSTAYLRTKKEHFIHSSSSFSPLLQNSSIRFKDSNPVVNENKQITLTAVDFNGQPVNGVMYESGSPDIASVDPLTGTVTGVKQGFATITAKMGSDSVSTFVVVAKVRNSTGAQVMGDTKTDTGGRIYISDPTDHLILRKDSLDAGAVEFAGKKGMSGRSDGGRTDSARFSGPTAVAIDKSTGNIYIADTLNHSIRKIDNQEMVTTEMGNGSPGMNPADLTQFRDTAFRGLRGVAIDTGGNLFIADTENHAIYVADFVKKELRLLAGQPGVAGKADGRGRMASFTRPYGIALRDDGRSISVADRDNGRVRLVTLDGTVTTIGRAASSGSSMTETWGADQTTGEIEFDAPESVSFDSRGNIYVVDRTGVKVVTDPTANPQVVRLAQDGTFVRPMSVVVDGTQVIVLDNNSTEEQAVKVVTVGAPEITGLSRDSDLLEGGSEVVITGKNFAPESQVVLGDRLARDFRVVSATEIRLIVPKQNAPGVRTISVLTRGGVAQREFIIKAKRFEELSEGEITTIVGGVAFLGDGGLAANANLTIPSGVAIDSVGNLFIADPLNNRIRRVDTSGVITTVAGNGTVGSGGDGGPALSASLDQPRGVAVDEEGNLLIADTKNNRVRRVDAATGVITTVAGGGMAVNEEVRATDAALRFPTGLAVDRVGNIFIMDSNTNRIRRVDVDGIIKTVAGNGQGGFSGDGGLATNASLRLGSTDFFGSIALDKAGHLFIADSGNSRVRRVDATTGIITTVAGGGMNFPDSEGPATGARLSVAYGIAIDGKDNLFIADSANNRIRKVDASGKITTIAGSGIGFGGDGGQALRARLLFPTSIVVDGSNNLIIADTFNNRIRRVDAVTGSITTMAGTDTRIGDNGPATNAGLTSPQGVAVDTAGNILIIDSARNRIRRVDAATGIITTIAGNGDSGFNGDGIPATSASLSLANSTFFGGIAADRAGNIFIADTGNQRIRRIDRTTGNITTVAGSGRVGFSGDGGQATGASFISPQAVAVDDAGNLYITDTGNNRIRQVDPNGIIRTIAGNGLIGMGGDNGPAINASLANPLGIKIDGAGNLIFADFSAARIRRVNLSTRIITTVAGTGFGFGGDGGQAVNARLNFPTDIALDRAGNLFIADFLNQRIRRVDVRTGIITTVAGSGVQGYRGDGGLAAEASLGSPEGIAIDTEGNLLIADTFNNAIRVVKGIATGVPAPPKIGRIDDQMVKAGEVRNISVSASDLEGIAGLKLSLQSTLPFVSFVDNGNGRGTIRIAPPLTERTGGTVTVQATDTGGLSSQVSFNIMVLPDVKITGATFKKPNFSITGVGFGVSGATVIVNGVDKSSLIENQNDTLINLKGSKKKLGLVKGPNQITIRVGGVTSNTFVLNLLAED
jgi:sugar lactone lactonase YvrE